MFVLVGIQYHCWKVCMAGVQRFRELLPFVEGGRRGIDGLSSHGLPGTPGIEPFPSQRDLEL